MSTSDHHDPTSPGVPHDPALTGTGRHVDPDARFDEAPESPGNPVPGAATGRVSADSPDEATSPGRPVHPHSTTSPLSADSPDEATSPGPPPGSYPDSV